MSLKKHILIALCVSFLLPAQLVGAKKPRRNLCGPTLTFLGHLHFNHRDTTFGAEEFDALSPSEKIEVQAAVAQRQAAEHTTFDEVLYGKLAEEQVREAHQKQEQKRRAQEDQLRKYSTRVVELLKKRYPGATITAKPIGIGGVSLIFEISNAFGGPFIVKTPKYPKEAHLKGYQEEVKIIEEARKIDPEGAKHLAPLLETFSLTQQEASEVRPRVSKKRDGTYPEIPFVVVRKGESGSLADNLHKFGPNVSQEKMLKAMKQMALGIRAVHRAGFIHRDVKPHNFVLSEWPNGDHYYLIDLGLAGKPGETPVNGFTASYAPHEQTMSVHPVAPHDMHSLQITFKEMMMGQTTWKAADELLAAKKEGNDLGTRIEWHNLQLLEAQYPVLLHYPNEVLQNADPKLLALIEEMKITKDNEEEFISLDAFLQKVDQAIEELEVTQ